MKTVNVQTKDSRLMVKFEVTAYLSNEQYDKLDDDALEALDERIEEALEGPLQAVIEHASEKLKKLLPEEQFKALMLMVRP